VKTENGRKARGSRDNRRSLGLVQDLEAHVKPDWWQRIFNAIYVKTDGDVIDDQQLTAAEVTLFADILKLKSEEAVLDLCCGQGRHTLELARRGFGYLEGLDRSHYLIQRAKVKARKEGLAVKFREGDARRIPYPPDRFDALMILGNSFGYFDTVEDDLRVLKEVFRVLKPCGRLLVDVADGSYLRRNFQPRSWEWVDRNLFVCRERSLSRDTQRLISREVVTHVGKGVVADQFYAERLYTAEDLIRMLESAGFSQIAHHGELATESLRNQDLGMMARRLLISAVAKKEWTPVRRPKAGVRAVAVVMGDPRKLDPLKPQAHFDEDDLYTIDQLKDGMRTLSGYHFHYLDNHDSLLHDLTAIRGKVNYVFNLCDEGFGNNALHELHVPALLEMLGLSYTGAGPQCLGICYDKSLTRGLAKEMEIPVPEAFLVKPEDSVLELPVGFPVIVKPNFGDSSFGITQRSVAGNIEELANAVTEIRQQFGYEKPVLVEEFLTGKDLTVGIIGNPPESYSVLPIVEEDYSSLPPELPRICGYEAKWLPDSPYWNLKSVPVELPEDVEKFIVACCARLFERLECRDYCRFDWRLDEAGNPKLLEVNPNPGWCWDGHLAKMAKLAGMSYREMLTAILGAAENRLGLPRLDQSSLLSGLSNQTGVQVTEVLGNEKGD